MNALFSKHARKGFTGTSIATAANRDAKSLLHADSRNLKGSENFAVSFGDFKGGLLWIEGTKGRATLRTLLCILPHTYTIVCYLGLVPALV